MIFPISHSSRNRGVALIVTLLAISLLLALVISFFTRVRSESHSSGTYQAVNQAQTLADFATNTVLAQIKSATSVGDSTTWASQPGAIRTYDNSGNLIHVYKLYSSDQMILSGAIDPEDEANALTGWHTSPAIFTDLNEPTIITHTGLGGTDAENYPIMNPYGAASFGGNIPGFDIDASAAPATSTNKAPMPARWLYILEDGQMVSPVADGSNATIANASQSNPIIGRIAFWTDDDTSKINVNTAGGGPWVETPISVSYQYGGTANSTLNYNGPGFSSFWSTPLVFSIQEGVLARNQPAQHEYQRYPGHPANTFLSAALPDLHSANDIYRILPKLDNATSSMGGSQKVSVPTSIDSNRLYQNIDELLFAQPTSSDSERPINPSLTSSDLEKAKFLLTASSRAPDVNLFNEPKIGLWPINPAKKTPYDALIAFCETINKYLYYFTRTNPHSATADISNTRNQEILDYLRRKTSEPVPGFGGTSGILGKYGNNDRDQTLVQIFDYIRTTNPRDSSQATPGGVVDTSFFFSETGAVVPAYDSATDSRGFGRFPTVTKAGILFYTVATNQASADQTKISRTSPVRIGTPENEPTDVPAPGKSVMRAILLLEMFIPAQGYGIVNPRCSLQVSGLESFRWSGSGGQMFDLPSGTLEWNQPNIANQARIWRRGENTVSWGGRIGWFTTLAAAIGPTGTTLNHALSYPFVGTNASNSPEVNSREDDPSATFAFSGGTLTIEMKDPQGTVVQNYDIQFPPTSNVPVPFLAPNVEGDTSGSKDFRKITERLGVYSDGFWACTIKREDVVRAVAVGSGDFRLVAARQSPAASLFEKHPFYDRADMNHAHNFMHNLPMAFHGAGLGSYADITKANVAQPSYETSGNPVDSINLQGGQKSKGAGDKFLHSRPTYLVDTYTKTGVKVGGTGTAIGDWDNGVGRAGDGPYINYPDEGTVGASGTPYLGFISDDVQLGAGNFSPNRMMPSAVTLGSLPTEAAEGKPWQTLLFRPQPTHPGANNPPDYLLLDFFNMPVVEPYAISEPLSTAGRVNMNYQILPYTYIKRSTAVQAVLRSEQMLLIPSTDATIYKRQSTDSSVRNAYRFQLNLNSTSGTLKGFEDKFSSGDIFRSASEICSLWLVPDTAGASYNSMESWWDNYLLTGDNAKESSYARIYPRLTTKSNTYTIHYRVQALKKSSVDPEQNTWKEDRDVVSAEYRGSTTIERYIDPNDPNIPDYITETNPKPLDEFYKFRVISNTQFNP